jgi:chemotaxis protein MotB
MLGADKKIAMLLSCFALFTLVSGCTNWKDKYDKLNVEYENLKGLRQSDQETNKQLAEDVSAKQAEIDALKKQIEVQKKSPADASGFSGLDVKFDPNAGTITVTLASTLLFDSGKVELKKTTIAELDKVSSVIKQKYSSKMVDVVGHTDTDPINKTKDLWKDNWELSAQRALAVLRYLQGHGINEKYLRAVGSGEAHPVDTNSTAAGKARNRRVEIVVHMK